MAKLVFAAGVSHTPMLVLPVEDWRERAQADRENDELNLSDGRRLTYAALLDEIGPKYSSDIVDAVLREKHRACMAALDRLASDIARAQLDVMIIVGDDQAELFSPAIQPALTIFHGACIRMSTRYANAKLPRWLQNVAEGYYMNEAHEIAGHSAIALGLINGLIERHVDVAASDSVPDPARAGFGHAFGFVVKRLFADKALPVVPMLLNTYYPPNVPTAARCHDIGKTLRRAIGNLPGDSRIGLIASGGLSHFVVDAELDRHVLRGCHRGGGHLLRNLPRGALQSGSSEILNWVVVAGAVEERDVAWMEYQPLRRTDPGTGVGAAFVVWNAEEDL